MTERVVVGVDWDGDRRGGQWVCVALDAQKPLVATRKTFAEVLSEFADAAVVAVDMPVGFPTGGPGRRCDLEAAALVGASRVFPTYPREVYELEAHGDGTRLCIDRGWKKINRQSHGLRQRIFEVEPHTNVVVEVHPEVSFFEMNRRTRLPSKHTWTGLMMRRRLLEAEGIAFPEFVGVDVGSCDLLDAAAVAWTARRVGHGAQTLPAKPSRGESTITY